MSLPPQKNGNNGRMTPTGIEPASQPWKGRITNRLDHGAMRGSIAATLVHIWKIAYVAQDFLPCSRKIGIWTQICGFGDHCAATYTILLFFPAMPDMELTGIEPVSRISTHAEPLRRFCACSPV